MVTFKTCPMKKIIISACSIAVVLIACTPKASPSKTEEIMPKTASTATADIAAGHTIFTTNCIKCHAAKTDYVNNHTYEQARPVMASMSEKSKLTPEQVKQLAAYVYSVSKK